MQNMPKPLYMPMYIPYNMGQMNNMGNLKQQNSEKPK